jgi:methyl-accepting chemotaxis protein
MTTSLLSRSGTTSAGGRGSISTRLIKVFVFTIAMAGLTAGIGAYELHVGAQRTTSMYRTGVQGIDLLRDANSRNFEAAHSGYEGNYALTAQDYRDLQKEASDKMGEAIDGMRQYAAIAPASQKGAVAAQIQTFQTIQSMRDDMMSRYAADRGKAITAAEHASVDQIEGLIDTADTNADKLVAAQQAHANGMAKAANDAASQSLLLLILSLVASIVVSTFAIRRVLRSVTGRIKHLTRAAERMAVGDMGYEIDASQRDELGVMGSAFQGMVESVRGRAAAAEAVAGGDLTVEVEPLSDEDVLGASLKGMVESLRELVGRVAETADYVSSAAEQSARTSEETSRAVAEIAESTEVVARNAEEQVALVRETRESADGAAQTAADARTAAAAGIASAEGAVGAMRDVDQAVSSITAVLEELGKRSTQIGAIVEAITAIAEQTNLLALNAAIEAARAGEHGRGFAVVADEVRKLAEQARSSAAEIGDLLAAVGGDIERAVTASADGGRRSEAALGAVTGAGEAFREIHESILEVDGRANTIAGLAPKVLELAERTNDTTSTVSASAEEASAASEEMAASAAELSTTATGLASLVGRFRVR